jgi:hypothetical protein
VTQLPQSQRKIDAGRIKGAQAVPNALEIQIRQIGANGKSANFTCHAQYATTPPSLATLAAALFTSIGTAWGTNLGPQMAAASRYTGVWIRDMANVNNPIIVGTGAPTSGTNVGMPLPPEVCIVLTENTIIRGKGMKGRMFISGWADSASDLGGVISDVAFNAVTGFGTALFAAITAQNLTPCVAEVARQSYIGLTGTTHLNRTAKTVGVSSYTARNNEFDTQRRRGLNG